MDDARKWAVGKEWRMGEESDDFDSGKVMGSRSSDDGIRGPRDGLWARNGDVAVVALSSDEGWSGGLM